jgi:two-component system OmpR family sensor kinase
VLINDLLNLAHIESSGFKADIKKVEARPVIEAALSLAKPPRGKSVRVDVPSDTFVAGDPTRFGQVIENLLSNAYEYGGTDIVIAARSDGDETELTVEDNGDGVPDEIRPRLFDPFTRGHTDSKGSGLGLSIVKRLVEAFGGLITYEPGRPQGSRFVMRLRSDVDSPHA